MNMKQNHPQTIDGDRDANRDGQTVNERAIHLFGVYDDKYTSAPARSTICFQMLRQN